MRSWTQSEVIRSNSARGHPTFTAWTVMHRPSVRGRLLDDEKGRTIVHGILYFKNVGWPRIVGPIPRCTAAFALCSLLLLLLLLLLSHFLSRPSWLVCCSSARLLVCSSARQLVSSSARLLVCSSTAACLSAPLLVGTMLAEQSLPRRSPQPPPPDTVAPDGG